MPQEDKKENPETPDNDANSTTSKSEDNLGKDEDKSDSDALKEDKSDDASKSDPNALKKDEDTTDVSKPDSDAPEEDKKRKASITKEGLIQLIELNIQGMTNQQIADKLNLSLSIVQKALSLIESLIKSDAKKRKQPITKEEIIDLIELNQQGMVNEQIAKKLNVSLSSVQKVISYIKKAKPIRKDGSIPISKGKIVQAPTYIKTIRDKTQYVLIKYHNKYIPDEFV